MHSTRPVIVIDPAHGGTSSAGGSSPLGAAGPFGLIEKDVALDLSQRVGDMLAAAADIRYTRELDENLSLSDRARIGRDAGAALFLSLHLNQSGDPYLNGSESWVARDADPDSRRLAERVSRAVAEAAGIPDRGVKQRNLGQLASERHGRGTAACLLEVAYLSHPDQARKLTDSSYRDELAAAVASAVLEHLGIEAHPVALVSRAQDQWWKGPQMPATRPSGALGGKAFIAKFAGSKSPSHAGFMKRDEAMADEIISGNFPEFLRNWKKVKVSFKEKDGTVHEGTYRVMPDVLSIGGNSDFIRVPLSAIAAQKIADAFSCYLPTAKMIEDIYKAAEWKISVVPDRSKKPDPFDPSVMQSTDTFVLHNKMIEAKMDDNGPHLHPGPLVEGHKKNVIISPLLHSEQYKNSLAFYGFFDSKGVPVQPCHLPRYVKNPGSCPRGVAAFAHEPSYADYSHGVRLVHPEMEADGKTMYVRDVLKDKVLCKLLSKEGPIPKPWIPAGRAKSKSQASMLAAVPEPCLPKTTSSPEKGSEFMKKLPAKPPTTKALTDREDAIIAELKRGNMPSFLRKWKPVAIESGGHKATFYVTPDYLAVGTGDDYARVPLDAISARDVASEFCCLLPTVRMVEHIFAKADVQLVAKGRDDYKYTDNRQRSTTSYVLHNEAIQTQLGSRTPGSLIAGHKKDVVISKRLYEPQNHNKLAFFGFFDAAKKPIQKDRLAHYAGYADYSHGVRLVHPWMEVDGKKMLVADVLAHPDLHTLLSDEGAFSGAGKTPGGEKLVIVPRIPRTFDRSLPKARAHALKAYNPDDPKRNLSQWLAHRFGKRHIVIDKAATIRGGPPDFKATTKKIPQFEWVKIDDANGDYYKVTDMSGKAIGWTKASNIASLFKDDTSLASVALAPAKAIPIKTTFTARQKQIAECYNRVGGLLEQMATGMGIEVAIPLGIWWVESNGAAHTVNSAIIRFENHVFFDRWGSSNQTTFDNSFRFGTRAPLNTASCDRRHKCHQFRNSSAGAFASFHGDQTKEYAVLAFARGLNNDAALESISIGGPQIMGFHYHKLGYDSAQSMFDAFQASERPHVIGFFDFLLTAGLIAAVKAKDWTKIGSGYNGNGAVYGPKLKDAYDDAVIVLAARP